MVSSVHSTLSPSAICLQVECLFPITGVTSGPRGSTLEGSKTLHICKWSWESVPESFISQEEFFFFLFNI